MHASVSTEKESGGLYLNARPCARTFAQIVYRFVGTYVHTCKTRKSEHTSLRFRLLCIVVANLLHDGLFCRILFHHRTLKCETNINKAVFELLFEFRFLTFQTAILDNQLVQLKRLNDNHDSQIFQSNNDKIKYCLKQQ